MATISEYKTILEKLDGKQSISVPINIKKNGVLFTEPVDVIIRGFLKFEDIEESASVSVGSNELEDKTVVHPVIFSSDVIRVDNGRCVVVFLPRSEDLFEVTRDIQTGASTVDDSDIVSQGGIRPDEQITDDDKNPVVIKIETGVIREPYKLSLEATIVSVNDISIYSQTIDRGTTPKIEVTNDIKFLFHKSTKRSSSNLVVDCFSDLEWMPSVNAILANNNASRISIISALQNLRNTTPLGTSTMYDAVVAGARILSGNSDSKKTIYVFTDNESNISLASIDNAIEEVNDIDGDRQVPILIGNMTISDKAILSIKANRSDTKNINKLSFLTGGQSATIVDESFLEDIVGIFYRGAVGAMGYGTYEFIKDFGEEVLISNISAIFDIPPFNTNATWAIETSIDGYNYIAIDVVYNYSDSIDFEDLLVRYVKFKIVMISGMASDPIDEYGTTPDVPSLTSIRIVFNANRVAYLYINKEEVDVQLYQITLAVDANEINNDQIKAGVAKSDSHNWTDYSTESQPTVDQNGKVIIPIRFSQDINEFQQEPLKKINNFITRTEYGKWDYFATTILYNKDDNVIPSDTYKLYSREGRIVFNNALPSDYQDGDYKIGIINSDKYKVGLKLTNKTETDVLDIYGIGHMYTTGKDLLPPSSKASPEVQEIEITNEFPNRFSVMEASYTYFDSNFEPEDISQRRIKWFINGEPISYLENVIKWNDVINTQDPVYTNTSLTYPTQEQLAGDTILVWVKKQINSILKSEDKVHVEIQVSDGTLLSNKGVSNIVEVVESVPVLSALTVMAEDENGNIISRLATDTKAVLYPSIEDSFFTDGSNDNQSEILWYVNDEIFKRGIYGQNEISGQSPIHEIWINEIGTSNYIDYGLRIANTIFAQVVPQTGGSVGEPVTTPVITVKNALPRVFDVQYVTSNHDEHTDIIVTWSFFDFEIDAIGDLDESGQVDQTEVHWYRRNPGDTEFTLVYSYNDHNNNLQEIFYEEDYRGNITTNIGNHVTIVNDDIIAADQEWFVTFIPHDKYDSGVPVSSEIITITSATN